MPSALSAYLPRIITYGATTVVVAIALILLLKPCYSLVAVVIAAFLACFLARSFSVARGKIASKGEKEPLLQIKTIPCVADQDKHRMRVHAASFVTSPKLGTTHALSATIFTVSCKAVIPTAWKNVRVQLWTNALRSAKDDWYAIDMALASTRRALSNIGPESGSRVISSTLTVHLPHEPAQFEFTVRALAEDSDTGSQLESWASSRGAIDNAKIVFNPHSRRAAVVRIEDIFTDLDTENWNFIPSPTILASGTAIVGRLETTEVGASLRLLSPSAGLRRRNRMWFEPYCFKVTDGQRMRDIVLTIYKIAENNLGIMIPSWLIDFHLEDNAYRVQPRKGIPPGTGLVVYIVSMADGKIGENIKIALEMMRRDTLEYRKNHGSNVSPSCSLQNPPTHNEEEAETFNDGLGWCTWNAFYQDVSEKLVLEGLESLKKANINPKWVLIDDGWQDTVDGRLRSVKENSKFPSGLAELVNNIKNQFPGIDTVGVWHTLAGYWNGVANDGDIALKYNLIQLGKMPGDSYIVHPTEAGEYYSEYHNSLRKKGILFMKVDDQVFFDSRSLALDPDKNIDGICMDYQDALVKDSSISQIDWCMAHVPVILYYGLLCKLRDSPVRNAKHLLRSSDDYFPDIPNSHTWHIQSNAFNALLLGQLAPNHIILDWDMFTTTNSRFSELHAIARSMSNGPIYIADGISNHDPSVLEPCFLNGVALRGPPGSRAAMESCVFDDLRGGLGLLFVANQGWCMGYGSVGAFESKERDDNDDGAPVSAVLRLADIEFLEGSELVGVSLFKSGKRGDHSVIGSREPGIFDVMARADGEVLLSLPQGGADVVHVCPIRQVEHVGFGFLGVTSKYHASAVVKSDSTNIFSDNEGSRWAQLIVNLSVDLPQATVVDFLVTHDPEVNSSYTDVSIRCIVSGRDLSGRRIEVQLPVDVTVNQSEGRTVKRCRAHISSVHSVDVAALQLRLPSSL